MTRVAGGRPLVFLGGASLVVLSLAYLIYGGIQQGATYWVTVGELEQRTPGTLPSEVRLAGRLLPDRSRGTLLTITSGS